MRLPSSYPPFSTLQVGGADTLERRATISASLRSPPLEASSPGVPVHIGADPRDETLWDAVSPQSGQGRAWKVTPLHAARRPAGPRADVS